MHNRYLNIRMGAGKPPQKFELHFQKDISEQIKCMKTDQLMDLFVAILNSLSISFVLMTEYNTEFIQLFNSLGKALAEEMKPVKMDSHSFDNMAGVSKSLDNPFLIGLRNDSLDKKNMLGVL